MRNITVSVDDDTYRRSRVRAAELDTSVSALVRTYLRSLAGDSGRESGASARETEWSVELRRRKLDEVLADFDARGVGLRSRDNLTATSCTTAITQGPRPARLTAGAGVTCDLSHVGRERDSATDGYRICHYVGRSGMTIAETSDKMAGEVTP